MVYFQYTMEITTIKIQKKTKSRLDRCRANSETYDQIIDRIITLTVKKNRNEELRMAYQSMHKEDLELFNEWEAASEDTA